MFTDKYPTIKGLIIDMDGVLWHGSEPIGDLPAIFESIRAQGLKFVLATNNSGSTIPEYQEKLANMGVQVSPEHVLTSADATFAYIRDKYPTQNTVYIVGTDSFKKNGKDRGFIVLDDDDDQTPADFVLVGLDRTINYKKLDISSRKIRNGALFIATNTDATYPMPHGLTPGAGTIVTAIQTASGETPFVVGKPEHFLYHYATRNMALMPEQILCIGDRLNTDILGAHKGGFRSAFVLSGVNTLEDLENWDYKPDLVVKDLSALIHD